MLSVKICQWLDFLIFLHHFCFYGIYFCQMKIIMLGASWRSSSSCSHQWCEHLYTQTLFRVGGLSLYGSVVRRLPASTVFFLSLLLCASSSLLHCSLYFYYINKHSILSCFHRFDKYSFVINAGRSIWARSHRTTWWRIPCGLCNVFTWCLDSNSKNLLVVLSFTLCQPLWCVFFFFFSFFLPCSKHIWIIFVCSQTCYSHNFVAMCALSIWRAQNNKRIYRSFVCVMHNAKLDFF